MRTFRWVKIFFSVSLLFHLGETLAQVPLPIRLEGAPAVLRWQKTPVLDQTGGCIGWFEASRSILLDTEGRVIMQSAGRILKHATNANGNTIAVLEKIASPKVKTQESFFTLRLVNRAGQSIGSYPFSQHRDDPLPQIIFAATGEYLLVAHSATARLIFLQPNGQVLRELFLFRDAPYANERPLFVAAGVQAFIALSQNTPTTNVKTAVPTLICFSISGEEQWRCELPAGTAGGLAVSADGAWIAASRYTVTDARVESTTSILNLQSAIQGTIDGLFRRVIFAKAGNTLLLMERRQLRAVDFRTGKTLWQINLARRAEMFVDIAATATHDKTFALAAENVFKENRFVFANARLLSFDRAGQQQSELPLSDQLLAPVLKISNDGHRLTLGAEGFLQQFTVVQSSR